MAFSHPTQTAISLDGGYLQVLQGSKKGKNFSVNQVVLEPFPKELELKEKSDIIQEMWRSHELKSRDVILVVPRSLWTVKMVTVPSSARETIQQVMDLNIEQYLPFSMAESLWDWEVLSQGPGEESRVLLMAMRKQDFDERMAVLKAAGLNLSGLEVSSVGLLSTVHYLYPEWERQRVAFIDLQHGWVDVLVVDRGEMTFSRGIELPKGIEAIPTWVGEVRHTLIAYDQNHPLGKIEKVVVVGSQEMLALLREKHFEEPIQRPYQPLGLDLEGSPIPAKANVAAHAGPVLRQLGFSEGIFHLSKAHLKVVEPPKLGVSMIPAWVWVGAVMAGLTALGAVGVHMRLSSQMEKLKSYQSQLKGFVNKPKYTMDTWDQFLYIVGKRMPGVSFDSLDFPGERVVINAKAETAQMAYDFQRALKTKPEFANATIDNLRIIRVSGGKEMIGFSMRIDFKRPAKKITTPSDEDKPLKPE